MSVFTISQHHVLPLLKSNKFRALNSARSLSLRYTHSVPGLLDFPHEIPTQTGVIYPGTRSDISPHITDIAHTVTTTGITLFTSLGISAPFDVIKVLFNHLAARMNATYPKHGVYKAAGLHKPDVDQKITVDLSAVRLEHLNRLSPELMHELGAELKEAIGLFKCVKRELIPRIMQATSNTAGFDMDALHMQRNNNYRMIDYFAKSTAVAAPRCGIHRDYGMFSIILYTFHSA
jgi:hypothetical protein